MTEATIAAPAIETPAAVAPAAAPAADAPVVVGNGWNSDQIGAFVSDMRSSGRFADDAAIMESLKADGVIAGDAKLAPAQTAAEIEADQIYGKPASATDFTLPKFAADTDTLEDIGKIDGAIRGWLTDLGAPRTTGEFLANEVARLSKETEHWSPADSEVYARKERQTLERIHGEQYPAKLKAAQRLVRDIDRKRPGLVAVLENSRAGSSAVVIEHFIRLAEARTMRKGARR